MKKPSERQPTQRRTPPRGTPVTRGDEFLGLQMSLLASAGKAEGRRATPQATEPETSASRRALVHLLCPRCGRYLGSALAGASALCPRCGVWSTGH